jgi:SAM-dependent methyltransferase
MFHQAWKCWFLVCCIILNRSMFHQAWKCSRSISMVRMSARMHGLIEEIFDITAISRFRERALGLNRQDSDFLIVRMAEDMAERLSCVNRKFQHAAITSWNMRFVPENFLHNTRHKETRFASFEGRDSEERLDDAPRDLDLALSFLSLHETNDTPGALVQIRQTLKPDGLFMGVMPGGDTLHELRQCLIEAEMEICGGASPRVYPFADVRSVGSLLQRAGFALPVVDSETITVRYNDIFALMRDLRGMGAANALMARSKSSTRRSMFLRAAAIYQEKYGQSDGKIPATFTFIWMSGWAPDASQQKPSKRGSATVSLGAVLKA